MIFEDPVNMAFDSHLIILDISFATRESFRDFLQEYKHKLRENPMLVPSEVFDRLKSFAENRDGPFGDLAPINLAELERAEKQKFAKRQRSTAARASSDREPVWRLVRAAGERAVMVLTHDEKYATELREAIKGGFLPREGLVLAGIDAEGKLFTWQDRCPEGGPQKNRSERITAAAANARLANTYPKRFELRTEPDECVGRPLPPVPGGGPTKTLFTRNGSAIELGRELARGGEGTIHETNDKSVLCRIYFPEKRTMDRMRKIELMEGRAPSHEICWPRGTVYGDREGTIFRGFLMPRAPEEARPLGHTLFIPSRFTARHPRWTRLDSALLAGSIVHTIRTLHSLNVLIGDINPLNILMNEDRSIFFVDCDSYQIDGYPCPVGSVNFTAPEIHEMHSHSFEKFLRTKEHELFSVATLLFMIFMPGKSPYSHQGGENGAANIKKKHFPYAIGEQHSDRAPNGPWQFCWSHLTYDIKAAFHKSFHGKFSASERVSLDEWLKLIQDYITLLNNPSATFNGPLKKPGFDLSVLPKNLRRVEKDGKIKPPWPDDGLTDQERMLRNWE